MDREQASPEMLARAREIGRRDGKTRRHHCTATFETGAEYVAWYEGWRSGRDEAEDEIVRMGVQRAFARHFYGLRREA